MLNDSVPFIIPVKNACTFVPEIVGTHYSHAQKHLLCPIHNCRLVGEPNGGCGIVKYYL